MSDFIWSYHRIIEGAYFAEHADLACLVLYQKGLLRTLFNANPRFGASLPCGVGVPW